MQISNVAGLGSADQGAVKGASGKVEKKSFAETLAELNDFAKGTPAQQMEKQILAKLGITEKELKEMSPEERAKVMEQVREMIKRELTAQQQTQTEKKISI